MFYPRVPGRKRTDTILQWLSARQIESQESAQVCCLSACSSLPEALYGSGEFKLISSNFNANTWSPGKCLDLHS